MLVDAARPALRLVPDAPQPLDPWTWFCGHCGAPPADPAGPEPSVRVCSACGLGLMHQARSEAAPRMDDAFVIVDSSLSIQAVSRAAETILGAREHEVVNRHVTELLLPVDSEPDAAASLAPAITRAASGEEGPTTVFVRPGATFGVRLSARIAPCGPPRAALVVLE